jgi:hypothetical protein
VRVVLRLSAGTALLHGPWFYQQNGGGDFYRTAVCISTSKRKQNEKTHATT